MQRQDTLFPNQDVEDRACANCGAALTRRPGERRWGFSKRKSCSVACARALKTPSGPRGPYKKRVKPPRPVSTCLMCGTLFDVPPNSGGKFCSRPCYHQSRERLITCERCGKQFKRRDSAKRPSRFCSRTCMQSGWDAERMCAQCGDIFTPTRQNQRCCSKRCATTLRHARDLEAGKRVEHPEFVCQYCGEVFRVFPSAAKRIERPPLYCSQPCKHAAWRVDPVAQKERRKEYLRHWATTNRHKISEKQARRRARKLARGPVEEIDREVVVTRDGAVCYLCQEPIDLSLSGWHPMGLTLDHVIPLSRGGSHTLNNLKPTHRACNVRKSARTPEEYLSQEEQNAVTHGKDSRPGVPARSTTSVGD